ncbi:MAG TPA: hypothetical protein VJG32_15500 [Anaerolineae bacterium]|nr:hypothetical protein [Anaerolineae bacterium]
MREALQHDSRPKDQVSPVALTRGMLLGLIGGLLGTFAIDLTAVGTLLALGYSGDLSYYIAGYTAAGFFSGIGLNMTGSVLLGVAMRYLIGLGLGVVFGATVSRVHALRADTAKRVLFSLLYVAVISQPLLAAAPIIMQSWDATTTWQWFFTSFFIHMIYAVVLAAVVGYGLRADTRAKRRWFWSRPKLSSPESTVHQ